MPAKVSNHIAVKESYQVRLSRRLQIIVWISISVICTISIMDLIGWITGITWLKSAGPYWEPMKVITAVCFLLTSLALASIYKGQSKTLRTGIPLVGGIFLLIVSALTIFIYISAKVSGHESDLTTTPVLKLFLSHQTRMALLSAFIFILIGVILIILPSKKKIASDISHILCLLAALAGYMIPVSYLLKVSAIHEFLGTPVALMSGISFVAVCTAVYAIRPDTWLMKVFTSSNIGGIISRRLLPWFVLLPLIIGWFRIKGEQSGYFNSEIGVLLVALTYTTSFILLIWYTARSVGRIDIKRNLADEALKKSYDELEARVAERTSDLLKLNKALDEENKVRIKAEKLLDSERVRMNGLLEIMPAYIILLTRDYHVAYSNRFFRERFGESSGKPCFEFLFNRSEPCEICETYKVLKDGQPHTWEWTGPDRHIYSIYDYPYSDSDGSPMIMETGIDITSLKKAETNLVILNSELEQRVKDRTSELERINERLNILSKTSGRLLESENPQALINSLCTRVMRYLDCQVSFNYLYDELKGKLHLNSYAGISEKDARKIEWLEYGVAICGCVARDGERIIAENIMETADPRTDLVRSFGIKAYACHPLLSNDKVLGTLSFGTATRERFSEDDISMMKSVANQVALAIGRVRNEDALRRSEERYRGLMELSPSASFVNKNNQIVLLNTAAKELLGYSSAEEVLGKSPFEIFHPDYHESILARFDKILKGGTVPVAVEQIIRGDGSVRDVEVVASGITDSEGTAIQVIMNDITERKLAEKELFDTKNYLQNLIDYANAPIIVWDRENKIRLFNHAFEHLTGYNASEVEGKKLDLLFPRNTLKESLTKIKQALTENWITIEIPILTKNKEIRTVLWNSAIIYDNSRKTISTIAQGSDITERIKAEQAFKESRDKLELALENGNIGTWEWEVGSDRLTFDERMSRMFGGNRETGQYTYDAFEKIIHEEDLPHVRNAFRQAQKENIPFETIFRIRNNKNDYNYISTKALVEKDKLGNPVKFSGVSFDITEMKKGAEKTLFLLNEELLRSNKELEQFVYVASHDLQEPLRMVSSFTQLLEQRYKDKLDQDAQDFIHYAVEGAIRMQGLINDLLDYSRIQTRGKKFAMVDMHEILGHAVKNLMLKIQKNVALVTNDELPKVVADEGQMVQLFQNLIENALKFCKTTPRVHVSCQEEKEYYLFSVKDNGIGINSQYYNRIFQIFQRLHPKDQYGGTGIGLAICKRIIDRHGGKIWVESKPGKGSVFYFTILKRQIIPNNEKFYDEIN